MYRSHNPNEQFEVMQKNVFTLARITLGQTCITTYHDEQRLSCVKGLVMFSKGKINMFRVTNLFQRTWSREPLRGVCVFVFENLCRSVRLCQALCKEVCLFQNLGRSVRFCQNLCKSVRFCGSL